MKKLFLFVCFLLLGTFLLGCFGPAVVTVTSIEVVSDETQFDQSFQLSDISVKVNRSNGSFETVPLSESMISSEDLAKFSTEGTHTINLSYLGATTSFEITIQGEKGDDGREVELQASATHIQWRYVGDTTWNNLIALTALTGATGATGPTGPTGPSGTNGADGKQIQLQTTATHIQWRYVGDTTWQDLMPVASLAGPAGQDGKAVEFQTTATHIQWRYVGDATWTNLLALTTITGATGPAGQDGKQIELQTNATHIQWRYVGDATWQDLLALSLITGATGATGAPGEAGTTPTIEINEDGFWVINGVVTTHKAVPDGGGTYVPPTYQVTFVLNGGVMPEGFNTALTVSKGDSIDLPIPTKDGYVFIGWFTGTTVNDIQFNSYLPITKNTTLYAEWEVDLTPLLNFYASLDTNNLTVEQSAVSLMQFGEMQAKFIMYNKRQMWVEGNSTFFYHEELEEEYIGDMNVPKEIYISNMFEQYRMIQSGVYEYAMFHRTNDYLDYQYGTRYWMGSIISLQTFDIEKFVKREGEQLYDYPIDVDTLMQLGVPANQFGDVEMTCYLDLPQAKLFITLSGVMEVEAGMFADIDATMELWVSNIGTTEVVIPFENIKTDTVAYFYGRLNEEIDWVFITEQSKQQFFAFLESQFTPFLAAQTLLSMGSILNQIQNSVNNYQFEFDTLGQEKFYSKEEITNDYNYRIMRATEDSILAMQIIWDQAMTAINDATTLNEVYNAVNTYYFYIEDAFIIDEEKAVFFEYKEQMANTLSVYMQLLSEYFMMENQMYQAFSIIEGYQQAIFKATTTEEVDQLLEEAYLDLLSNDFQLQSIDPIKPWAIESLNNIKQIGLDSLENPLAFLALYDSIVASIQAETNGFTLVHTFINGFYLLNDTIVAEMRPVILTMLEEIYLQYASMIELEQLPLLDAFYQVKIDAVNNTRQVWLLYNHINDFYNGCQSFAINSLRRDIYYAKQNLNYYFNDLKQNASDDSILAMQAIIDSYFPLFDAATNNMELQTLFNQAYNALEQAFELDPEKKELQTYKQLINDILYLYAEVLESAFVNEADLYVLIQLVNSFRDQVWDATSVDEINVAYEAAYHAMLDANFAFKPFENAKLEFQQMLMQMYHMGIFYFVDDSTEFDALFETANNHIDTQTNPITLVYDFVNDYLGINDFVLVVAIPYELIALEQTYLIMQTIVILEDHPLLLQAYNNAVLQITNAFGLWEVFEAMDNFEYTAWNLRLDPFFEFLFQSKQMIKNHFDELKVIATSDSILAMQMIVDEAILALDEATTTEEMDMIVYNTINALNAALIIDPVVQALLQAKEQASNMLYMIIYNALDMIEDDGVIHSVIWNLFYRQLNMLNNATTVEEVWLAFDGFKEQVLLLEYQFGNLDQLKNNEKEYIVWFYQNWQQQVDFLHPEIDAMVDQIILAINNATTPFEVLFARVDGMYALNDAMNAVTIPYAIAYITEIYHLYETLIVPSELTNLDNLFNQYQQFIEQAEYYGDIFYYMYDFEWACQNLNLDPLQYHIYQLVDSLQFEFRMLSHDATDDSIIAMQAILDQNIPLIQAATTTNDADAIYDTALNALFDAYELDPIKRELYMARDKYASLLYEIVENVMPIMPIPQEHHTLYNIIGYYQNFIYQSNTVEDVMLYFEAALEALSQTAISIDIPFDQLKQYILIYIQETRDEASHYINEVPEEIDWFVYDLVGQVHSSATPMEAIILGTIGNQMLFDMLHEQIKLESLANLEEIYQLFLGLVEEYEVEGLNVAYLDFIQRMQYSGTFDYPIWLVEDFYNFCYWLDLQPLPAAIYDAKRSLQFEFDMMEEDATADSIVAMQTVLDTFFPQIEAALAVEDVETLYTAALNALFDAFEEDPTKTYLRETQETYSNQLWWICNKLESFLSSWNDYNQLWDIYYQYDYQIHTALIDLEVFAAYQAAVEAINAYAWTDVNVEEVKTEILYYLLNFVSEEASYYLDGDYTILFNEAISEVTNILSAQTELGYVLSVYVYGRTRLNQLLFELMIQEVLAELDVAYNGFYEIVIESEIPALDLLYNQAYEAISNTNNIYDLSYYLNQFIYNASYLTFDEFKETIVNLRNSLLNTLNYFKENATADSIIAMENIFAIAIEELFDATTIEEAEGIAELAFYNLEQAYVPDEIKIALKEAKIEAINMIYDYLYTYVDALFANYSERNEISAMIDGVANLINQQTDITSVWLTLDAQWSIILNQPFEIDPSNISYYNYMIVNLLQNSFEYITNPFNGILPQEVQDLFDVAYAMITDPLSTPLEKYLTLVHFRRDLTQLVFYIKQAEFFESLQLSYTYYAARLYDEDLPALDALYAETFDALDRARDYYTMNQIWYYYLIAINDFPIDEVKEAKIWANNDLYYALLSYSQTATQDSIAAMTQVYEEYILLVAQQTTIDDVYNTKDQGMFQLFLAYVEDEEAGETVSVSFVSNGGTFVEPLIGIPGTYMIEPDEPEKEGYLFDGWFLDETLTMPFHFVTFPNNHITLYAAWISDTFAIYYYDETELIPETVYAFSGQTYILTENNQLYGAGWLSIGDITSNVTTLVNITPYLDLFPNEEIVFFTANSAGARFILTSFNRLLSWGSNGYGMLGDGTKTNSLTPIDITPNFGLDEDESIVFIDTNYFQTFAVTSKGRLFGWGFNSYYNIGNGTNVEVLLPYDITPNLNLYTGEKVIQVSVQQVGTMCLTSHNRIFTWGFGGNGQIGNDTLPTYQITPVNITTFFNFGVDEYVVDIDSNQQANFVLTNEGRLFVFGLLPSNFVEGTGYAVKYQTPYNVTPFIPLSEEDKIIEMQTNGDNSAVFFTASGDIFAYGFNFHNMLFNTVVEHLYQATLITGNFGIDVAQIMIGQDHTVILSTDLTIYAIGNNYSGQLAQNNWNTSTTPLEIIFEYVDYVLIDIDTYASDATLLLLEPTKDGFIFEGWYTDILLTEVFLDSVMPNNDLQLYAKWIQATT